MELEIGQRVYCKSEDLELDNVQGTVTRTKVLGCEDSVTISLDGGKQVAFFGPKMHCIGKTGPLSKDPTKSEEPSKTVEGPPPTPPVRKRVTKKKIASS
jgi:hypothetical protein